ncbi:MAG: hypothetical protein ACFFCO_12575 [Promethearchaeota archaeon]
MTTLLSEMLQGGDLLDTTSLLIAIIEIIIFPIITFVLGWFVNKIRKQLKFRTFRKVFGQIAENPENIIFSLPLWKVKDASRDSTRFEKVGFDEKTESFYGPDDTVAFDDLDATAHVASILAEFFPTPVNFTLDNDRSLEITGKTVIMIGSPLVNLRARSVLELVKQPHLDFIDQKETADHPARTGILDKRRGLLYDSSGNWQYSMILRVPNYRTAGAYFFLVFGAHAAGTLAAGIYLKNHWEEFKDADPAAGVVIEMPRSDIAHYRLVAKYGFPRRGDEIESPEGQPLGIPQFNPKDNKNTRRRSF